MGGAFFVRLLLHFRAKKKYIYKHTEASKTHTVHASYMFAFFCVNNNNNNNNGKQYIFFGEREHILYTTV